MNVIGIRLLSVRVLEVGRSVPTEPRASGDGRFLDGVEDGGSRATFDGSPGGTRPTSKFEALANCIHTLSGLLDEGERVLIFRWVL